MLPNSIVVGEFFERKIEAGGIAFSCFATEGRLEAMEKVARSAAGIIDYYTQAFGPSSVGSRYRLVEVDDRVQAHGALGTIFIPSRELGSKSPSVRDLARRIAYQWWLETVGINDRGSLWLVDGLAYYSAALYVEHANGPEAFREELNDLSVLALKFESKGAIRSGYDLGYRSETYQSVVAGKGAWVFNMLREVLGREEFGRLLRQYLAEGESQGGSAAAFEKLAGSLYGGDLRWFFGQ